MTGRNKWLRGVVVSSLALSLVSVPGLALADNDILAGEPIISGQVHSVSDVEWKSVSTGYGKSAMRDYRNLGNSDLNKYQMEVAGQAFTKGVGLHVPAKLELATDGACSQFLSYVGVDDSGNAANGSYYAKWIIEGTMSDGSTAKLAEVETRKGEIAPLIDVNISGVQTLTVHAKQLDGGNNGGSFADMGFATLNCTETPMAFDVRVFTALETNLEHLSPGGEVRLLVYDAQPNSDIAVKLNGMDMTTIKATDEGLTPVTFTIPVDIDQTEANVEVVAVDRVGERQQIALFGTIAISPRGQFYVDCEAPENGAGTEQSPYNSIEPINEIHELGAGSAILFKRGTECSGQLLLTGNGTADHRNIIGAYGAGDMRPTLNANGATNAIELVDASYWTIENLHLMNTSELTDKPIERQGIMVRSVSTAPKSSIVINDNVIDDVSGWPNKTGNNPSYRNSGAIVIMADHELSGPNPGLTNGITITNNELTNAGGGGIKLQGDGQKSAGKFHQNVYIAENNIHEVGGDAIVVHASDHARIESNRAVNLGQGKYPFQAGNFAGIWGMSSKELLFRYNVVGNSTDSSYDSTAWDCDLGMVGDSCTFEYNYSYNNAGGAYLDCISGCGNANTNTRAVMRYNVMQDDCRLGGASGGPAHTWIYNNTFYCPTRTFADDMAGPRTMFNNIIVAKEGSWDSKLNAASERVYSNNAYFGGIRPPQNETGAIIDIDPMLVAPGSAKDFFDIAGYELSEGSPLIGAGIDLDSYQGNDAFGNPAGPKQNIGAYSGDGIKHMPVPWDKALNTTSISHASNLRTGGVEFTDQYSTERGRGRNAYLAEALSVSPGEEVNMGDFAFVWDTVAAGTPDSVKATGQTVLIDQGGDTLNFAGFSTGDLLGGDAVVNYEDGSKQNITMELPNWRETDAEEVSLLSADEYNNHAASYLSSVGAKPGAVHVFGASVVLDNTKSKVASVTLPAGSPVIGEGLTLFALGVSGEMTSDPDPDPDPEPKPAPVPPATNGNTDAGGPSDLASTGASVVTRLIITAVLLSCGALGAVRMKRKQP